jgi:integrin alpha FG-GAP repeat containing protein 1
LPDFKSFSLVTTGVDALTALGDTFAAAFFDLNEDGSLDLLLMNRTDGHMQISTLFNNFILDAFSLKVRLMGHKMRRVVGLGSFV